jgi:hypothetical protein
VQKHRSYSDNELSCYGDNRPLSPLGTLQSQILRPHERVSAHKDPRALDKGCSYSCVPAPGDPPLGDMRSCRIFRWSEAHVRGDLFGGLKSCEVLHLDQDLHAGEKADAGYGSQEAYPVRILIGTG